MDRALAPYRCVLRKNHPRFRRDGAPWPELARIKRWPHCLTTAKFVNEEIQKLAEAVGAQRVVVHSQFFPQDAITPLPQDIIDRAKDRGIAFVSMDGTWRRRKDDNALCYFAEDHHLDTTGHRDIADQLSAALDAYRTGAGAALPAGSGGAPRSNSDPA